uniref:Uncharacterized protein n=1 Tax=Arundo donax TaxID=35708 RepID=A0A0A9A636_ARUDO
MHLQECPAFLSDLPANACNKLVTPSIQ